MVLSYYYARSSRQAARSLPPVLPMKQRPKEVTPSPPHVRPTEHGTHAIRRMPGFSFGICLALTVLALLVFAPVGRYDFVLYDDPDYVRENPRVRHGLTLANVLWAFTTTHAANWHPITWLSHMFDCHVFGVDPGLHHLVNVGFHAANAVLVFLVLLRLSRRIWPAAIVAALFTVHPLHVESVAWISERKDVLSTFFGLGTLWLYCSYVRHSVWWRYCLICIVYALSLMAKPMLVTLPAVLLLLDFWPLGRLTSARPAALRRDDGASHRQARRARTARREGARAAARANVPGHLGRAHTASVVSLVIEKLPLLILAVGSSIMTVIAQHESGAIAPLSDVSLWWRLPNAVVAYGTYLVRTAWPSGLTIFYPRPPTIPVWEIVASVALLALVSWVSIRFRSTRPHLLVGWLFYLLTLAPVIGLVQAGDQATADRFTYVPLLGVFIMIAWSVADLVATRPQLLLPSAVVGAAVLSAYATIASAQVRYWRDTTSLFNRALQVTARNHVAHNALGFALAEEGRLADAEQHFREAITVAPGFAPAHLNLGRVLSATRRFPEAESAFRAVLHLQPHSSAAHLNLARILLERGQLTDAQNHYERSLAQIPQAADAHRELGIVFERLGRAVDARQQYELAITLNPQLSEAHNDLGLLLMNNVQSDEAAAHFRDAIRIDPNNAEAHSNLGMALDMAGRSNDALGHYEDSLRLAPANADTHYNYGAALASLGDLDRAAREYWEALRLQPTIAEPHYGLGLVLKQRGELDKAALEFREALRLRPNWSPALRELQLIGR
jgi:protein O-mannosyl-transferase